MKLYFSGIASRSEASMLAGVSIADLLADTRDWRHIDPATASAIAIDSGAYRAWKAGAPLELDDWRDTVEQCLAPLYSGRKKEAAAKSAKLRFVIMPDVFGDASATWDRWRTIEDRISNFEWLYPWVDQIVPVWQWGSPIEHLEAMVAWCARATQSNLDDAGMFQPRADLVAIGGCVPWMRANDTGALAELLALSRQYGDKFHILGLNWLEAMMQLDPFVRSCDTSKWLDGARYGTWINDREGQLVVEAKVHCPRGQTRQDLCQQTAITLDNWCNKQLRGTAAPKSRSVRRYTLKPFVPPDKPIGPVNHLQLIHSLAENKKRHEEAKENFIENLRHRK